MLQESGINDTYLMMYKIKNKSFNQQVLQSLIKTRKFKPQPSLVLDTIGLENISHRKIRIFFCLRNYFWLLILQVKIK